MIKNTIMAIVISIAAVTATGVSANAMTSAPQIQPAVTQSSDAEKIIKVRSGNGHWSRYRCRFFKRMASVTGHPRFWRLYRRCAWRHFGSRTGTGFKVTLPNRHLPLRGRL